MAKLNIRSKTMLFMQVKAKITRDKVGVNKYGLMGLYIKAFGRMISLMEKEK